MSHDERYEAVRASIGKAMAEANALGWQGHEREAHVFLAMFDAAEGREPIPAPDPIPGDAVLPEGVPQKEPEPESDE